MLYDAQSSFLVLVFVLMQNAEAIYTRGLDTTLGVACSKRRPHLQELSLRRRLRTDAPVICLAVYMPENSLFWKAE